MVTTRIAAMCLLIGSSATDAQSQGPDLSGFVPVLTERFEEGLQRYDGLAGVWSTLPRRRVLATNGPQSVFLDEGVLAEEVEASIDLPLHITEEGLAIRSGEIPDAAIPAIRDYLAQTGQERFGDRVRYFTGGINTSNTWAQTYGYFEVTARIPRGKGHWPAFWLSHAGIGWPPEIDVFEAYGEGIGRSTPKDDQFNVAVFFDALDAERRATHSIDLANPYVAIGGLPEEPDLRSRGDRDIAVFHRSTNAAQEFGADIYGGFWTYAALWTPKTITFYFGKDRESLQEIYRTPTPPDLHVPMVVIANDQISSRWGWNPVESDADETFSADNAFVVRQITIMALRPEAVVDLSAGERPEDAGDSVIRDTAGDDLVVPGDGFDIIELSAGRDTIRLRRPTGTASGNRIIQGFGADDALALEGFPFEDVTDLMSRLTQVGEDVWLPSGAYPAYPHTIVFRDMQVASLREDQFRTRWPVTPDIWSDDRRRSSAPIEDTDFDGVLVASPEGSKLTDGGAPVRMEGGERHDIFMVGHADSTISDPSEGGVDTLIARVSFSLPPHVEVGVANRRGIALRGGDGDERLVARAAGVHLSGGAGDDLFVMDEGPSAVISISPGDGHDRIEGLSEGDAIRLLDGLWTEALPEGLVETAGGFVLELSAEQSLTFTETERQIVEAALTE